MSAGDRGPVDAAKSKLLVAHGKQTPPFHTHCHCVLDIAADARFEPDAVIEETPAYPGSSPTPAKLKPSISGLPVSTLTPIASACMSESMRSSLFFAST